MNDVANDMFEAEHAVLAAAAQEQPVVPRTFTCTTATVVDSARVLLAMFEELIEAACGLQGVGLSLVAYDATVPTVPTEST